MFVTLWLDYILVFLFYKFSIGSQSFTSRVFLLFSQQLMHKLSTYFHADNKFSARFSGIYYVVQENHGYSATLEQRTGGNGACGVKGKFSHLV